MGGGELPAGTVTFVLTDIEASARLWEEHMTEAADMLRRHDALFDDAVAAGDGVVVRPRGEGDSRFAVFARATDAVAAVLAFQRAVRAEPWPVPLRVRAAVHTGESDVRDGDYYGTAVNRCARVRSVAAGGQTLVTLATEELVRERLPGGATLAPLGQVTLRDIPEPQQLFELRHPELPVLGAPPTDLPAHNLPTARTSLIGREADLAAVDRRLATASIVSLVGAGGAGKTRLAHEVALRAVPRHRDGVWLVELQGTEEPADVPRLVAAAVGVREEDAASTSPLDALVRFLKPREAMIVLDNCEHLIDACADLVERVVAAAPAMTVLATSREPLGLEGESVYRVPSLEVPGENVVAGREVAASPAVQLFLERARASGAPLELTDDNAASIARICRRLDGIPLAIELAAPSANTLAPPQIEARLDEPFRLLVGARRGRTERQRTMRATIEWGYDLLEPGARTLLARLSVFAGGFTLDSAEAVAADDVGLPAGAVLPALQRLLDTSFVWSDTRGERARYRLAETIRQFAAERLVAEGDAAAARDAHLAWLRAWAVATEDELHTSRLGAVLDEIATEMDNVRTALRWAQERGDAAATIAICSGLCRYWEIRSGAAEVIPLLRGALASDTDPATRQRGLLALGILLSDSGGRAAASGPFEEAMAIGRTSDAAMLGHVAVELFTTRRVLRNETSADLLETARAIAEETGDRRLAASVVRGGVWIALSRLDDVAGEMRRILGDPDVQHVATTDPLARIELLELEGSIASTTGDPETAVRLIREAIEVARGVGALSLVGGLSSHVSYLLNALGRIDEADEASMLALEIARSGDRPNMVAAALEAVAGMRMRQGRYPEAHAALDEAAEIAELLGRPARVAEMLLEKSDVAFAAGEYASAEDLLRRVVEVDPPSSVIDAISVDVSAMLIAIARDRDIAAHLERVTEAYEQIRGLRMPGADAQVQVFVAVGRRVTGDLAGARVALAASARALDAAASWRHRAWVCEEYAAQLAAAGDLREAYRVFTTVLAERDRLGWHLSHGERDVIARWVPEAEAALGEEAGSLRAQAALRPFIEVAGEVFASLLGERDAPVRA